MILIADSGSTKTTWCVLKENKQKSFFHTEGYNPFFFSPQGITTSLSNSVSDYVNCDEVSEIFFYGAGCSTEKNCTIIEEGLRPIFRNADIHVEHDLLGATYALLQEKPGFVAILGTGTNTCLYDGQKITLCIDSLGFYLGDEGSGSHIGKKILRDYLRKYAPQKIIECFDQKYKLSKTDILTEVYHSHTISRYCAQFAKFVSEFYREDEDYFNGVLDICFTDFFEHLVIKYPEYRSFKFNCSGSVGYTFRDRISLIADRYHMLVGKIIRSPIDEIVKYHLNVKKIYI